MFSIKEAIVFGWHKVKAHSGLVFGIMLTMFALEVGSSVVQNSLKGTLIGGAASIVVAVLGVFLGAGMTLIFLRIAKGAQAEYRDIIPPVKTVWKYFCASVLTGVITLLPLLGGALVSLIILAATGSINFSEGKPVDGHEAYFAIAILVMLVAAAGAIYFALRYAFAKLAVLDGSEIMESLKASSKLAHGRMWSLVLFVLALVALNLLGFIALVVGLLVTIPISVLAFAHVYLKLKGHH